MKNMERKKNPAHPFVLRLNALIDDRCSKNGISDRQMVGELAACAGVTRQAISQYRTGAVLPHIDKLCLISDYFEVSTDYMLGRTDVPHYGNDIEKTLIAKNAMLQEIISDIRDRAACVADVLSGGVVI